MKCETIKNMMSSYIDKDLNNIEKAEFEKHLAVCEECREEYESLLDIIAACGNLEEIELPQNFRTELHQRLNEEKSKRNFFSGIMGSKRMKMATGLVAAALVIAIGIGSSSLLFDNSMKMTQESAPDSGYGAASAPAASPEYFDADLAMNKAKSREFEIARAEERGVSEDSVSMQFNESLMAKEMAPGQSLNGQAVESSRSGRMVIRSGNISVNVENVDKAAADIRQMTESSGGYVENSQIDNVTVPQVPVYDAGPEARGETQKYANMTVRVPETRFEDIFNNIKGMGELVSENMSGSDITAEYRDTTARVDNLKIQEQSLQQLMTKAKTVDEILKIESELNRVRTDIDINTGNLKRWDNLVQLSTIYIYMRELKPEELKSVDVPGTWEKAYQGFIKAVNNVVGGLQKTLILLVAAIPYLFIVGVIAALGFVIARKVKLSKIK
ncbi:MAG TPA: DUF4349 domain-containing protein [Bacillota bacterium]|jgi:hypothetical protein|nr:DUF4349 domain-containing protein [Bacillota bacterium]HRU41176.1 DUF4349 domain-containing protein [Candidatus Diapherotrites archaeon]